MKRKQIIAAVGLAALVVGIIYLWPTPDISPVPKRAQVRAPMTSSNPAMPPVASPSTQSISARSKASRILSNEEFDDKFSLPGVSKLKLRNAIITIAGNLQEMKGLSARIVGFDGKTLGMEVPALRLPDQALETVVMESLESALGYEKAKEIWTDPEGKQALLDRVAYNQIIHGTRYEFTAVKPENDPANNGSMGYALFNATWSYTNESGAPVIPRQVYKGFTFASAGNIGLSWNAMSKAPQGYFRSEPIKGQGSRDALSPIIIEDQKSGQAEILNARHQGSSDRLPRG